MAQIKEFLPLLAPYLIVSVGLTLTALVHVLRHPRYRVGSKIIWVPVVLLVQIIGPVAYFVFGRGDE